MANKRKKKRVKTDLEQTVDWLKAEAKGCRLEIKKELKFKNYAMAAELEVVAIAYEEAAETIASAPWRQS